MTSTISKKSSRKKKLDAIVASLNESDSSDDGMKSSTSTTHSDDSIQPEVINPYEGYTPPPRSQARDFKWLLRWNGFVSEDDKRFTKIYPCKTKAKSVDFLTDDLIRYATVNKETKEQSIKEYSISDAFMYLLYKG